MERLEHAEISRPRSFSGQCAQVLGWQVPLAAFDPHEVFGSCAFFEVCSTYFIRELVAACGPAVWKGQTFGQGTTVYREGDSGASMFIVVRGEAEAAGPGGGPGQLLGAGSFFGEAQLLGVQALRGETITADRPLRLLEVTCSAFTRLLQHTSEQEDSARPQLHTFSNERRHFEQLTAQLFGARRRGAPRVAKEKTTGAGAAPGDQEGDVSATTQVHIGALHRARELGPPSTPSPRQHHRTRPRISFLASGAPAAPPQAQEVCGLQNPRLWREARDRMTKVLISGGLPGGALACESYHQRLSESIKDDLQKGYLVPADVARRARTNMSAQQAIWTDRRRQQSGATPTSPQGHEGKTLFQAMKIAAAKDQSRPGTSSAKGALDSTVDADEGQRNMLSLQLLPGIDVMSVEQKHALAHDLEQRLLRQSSARRWKSATGVIRASSIRLLGVARDAQDAEAGHMSSTA